MILFLNVFNSLVIAYSNTIEVVLLGRKKLLRNKTQVTPIIYFLLLRKYNTIFNSSILWYHKPMILIVKKYNTTLCIIFPENQKFWLVTYTSNVVKNGEEEHNCIVFGFSY